MMESFQIVNVTEAKNTADAWGGKILSIFAAESANICWEYVWFAPEGFSITHHHPKSESNYYVDFTDKVNAKRKFTAYIGWPVSEARVYEIFEPTMLLIPANVVHTFSNDGDGEVFLLHAFSPPWKKVLGQSADTYDMMTQTYFTDGKKYSEYAAEIGDKYKNINELWAEFKRRGIY